MHVAFGASRCFRFGAALSLAAGVLAATPAWPAGAPIVPFTSRVADPAPDPLAAWSSGGDLAARADRARLAGLQVGVPSFDAAARALLLDGASDGTESARAATRVAPDLPLAQASLAARLLRSEHDVPGALVAAGRALAGLVRHREAALWLEATGFLVLRDALFFGTLALLACLAALHARAAAHDLGDRAGGLLPLFARAGLFGVLVLLPAIFGQGLLGLALSCFAVSLCYGGAVERRVALVAVLLLGIGLEVGSFGAARALVALDPDPVAAAVQHIEHGFPSGSERMRLEQASASDGLAARGLALAARREGRLPEAAERYESLLASQYADVSIANNAANVWMALGDVDRALADYERAVQLGPASIVLYNLSYAYGQAIRPRAQDETLQRLERVDPSLAFDLTQLQARLAGGFTLDLPVPEATLRARGRASPSRAAVATELRRALAPGALGIEPRYALAAFVVAAALARLVSGRFRPSGACHRCGGRLCPRCDGGAPGRELCAPCRRLFERPETADPDRRARRLAELDRRSRGLRRARVVASVLVPGAAGVLAGRPWLGLAGALTLCLGLASLAFSSRGIVDPLAIGAAGTLVFLSLALLCFLVHARLTVVALRRREEIAP